MSNIVIQEVIHPKFRKKETRTLEKAFLDTYLTDAVDRNLLDAFKLKLALKLPLYVFIEFFAYNSVGWTTMYDFEELKEPKFETPTVWLSQDLDLEKVSGSGQKVGEVGNALVNTINLLSKSSSEILIESNVSPINTLALNSLCLIKDFRLYVSLGVLVFLHQHNESLSHSLKQILADILKEFEHHCQTDKKIRLI